MSIVPDMSTTKEVSTRNKKNPFYKKKIQKKTLEKVSKCSWILKKYFSDFKKEGICVFCSLISSTVSLVIYVGAEVVRNFLLTKELAWVMWGCLGVSAFFIALVALMLFIKVCRCSVGLIRNRQDKEKAEEDKKSEKIEEIEIKEERNVNDKKKIKLKNWKEEEISEPNKKILEEYKKTIEEDKKIDLEKFEIFIKLEGVRINIVNYLEDLYKNNLTKFKLWKGFLGERFKDKISKRNKKRLECNYEEFVREICLVVLINEGFIEAISYIRSFIKEEINKNQISCARMVCIKINDEIKDKFKNEIKELKNDKYKKEKKLEGFKNALKKDKVIYKYIWEKFKLEEIIYKIFPREYIKNMEIKDFKYGEAIKDISRDIISWSWKEETEQYDKDEALKNLLIKIEKFINCNEGKSDILKLMKKNKLPKKILRGWVKILCNYCSIKKDYEFISKIFEIVKVFEKNLFFINKKVSVFNIINGVFLPSNIEYGFKKDFFQQFKEKIAKLLLDHFSLSNNKFNKESLKRFFNNYKDEHDVLSPIRKEVESKLKTKLKLKKNKEKKKMVIWK